MGVRKNWVGRTSGKLTVIREDKDIKFVWVECSCGSPEFKLQKQKMHGNTKSCGCLKAEYLYNKRKEKYFGKKFGSLTVLSQESVRYTKSGRVKIYLNCLCDCNKECVIRLEHISSGRTISCGCEGEAIRRRATNSRALLPKDEALSRVICNFKRAASTRNLEFSLTKEEVRELIFKSYHYCGGVSNKYTSTNQTYLGTVVKYNGLDRVDNNKGYILSNVVPCCWPCNKSKWLYTKEEFLNWVKRIVRFQQM